jgi:hypothetical protein
LGERSMERHVHVADGAIRDEGYAKA